MHYTSFVNTSDFISSIDLFYDMGEDKEKLIDIEEGGIGEYQNNMMTSKVHIKQDLKKKKKITK